MTSTRILSFLLILSLLSLSSLIEAKPILNKNKYLIATYDGYGAGVVSPNEGTRYQLIYDVNKNAENAKESDYWIINNISGPYYTFQNAVSGKYVRHDTSASSDREALVLVDRIYEDNSTSFILQHVLRDGNSHYAIISAVRETLSWNKRNEISDGVLPVGVYNSPEHDNSNFVFFDSDGEAVEDDGRTAPSVIVKRSLGTFEPYLSHFTINGKTPAPDVGKKEYYATLTDGALPAASLALTFDFQLNNPSHTLKIGGETIENGVPVALNAVGPKSSYELDIMDGTKRVERAKLFFTTLPVVQINSRHVIGDISVIAQISVSEADKDGDAELLLTKIKIRGGISRYEKKKNYSLNLRDVTGTEKENYTFFGLRNDNKWILDAMIMDPGRMRNRVSTDLWNDFATLPYWSDREEKMINGTRGQFVEVFLNDKYEGLYCMTERIDRKQLKLRTIIEESDEINNTVDYTQRGALYKSKDWSTAVMFGYPLDGIEYYRRIPHFDNRYNNWEEFEVKYPNDGEPIMWDNLYNAVILASDYYTEGNEYLEKMHETYDLPVYLDYYLFLELLLASDNHGKNTYVSIYDQQESPKVTVTPWDLDGTWGRRWNGTTNYTYADQDFDNFVKTREPGQLNIFERMRVLDGDEWESKKLKERYLSLRSNYFSHESLLGRFQNYAETLINSGAADREYARWKNPNLNTELIFLSNWIKDRLDYLDIQYLGQHFTSTERVGDSFVCGPNPVKDLMYISKLKPDSYVTVYNLQGVQVRSEFVADGSVQIDMSGLPVGIYIVKTDYSSSKIIKR